MKTRLSTQQIQRHILAPVMQKSISVLLMPISSLLQTIEQEIQNNPLLEIDEESRRTDESLDSEWQLKIQRLTEISDGPLPQGQQAEEDISRERHLVKNISLEEYLLSQLRLEIDDEVSLAVGEQIIGNIDHDGYFTSSCRDIAQEFNLEAEFVEGVLGVIQNLDPVGIASCSLKNCLLTQLKMLDFETKDLAERIVRDFLAELGRRKYQEISKKIGCGCEEVKEAARFIASLEPKPARSFRPHQENIYIEPDILIKYHQHHLRIFINDEDIPPLRISQFYKKMLRKPNLTARERQFIEERMQSALYFLRSINQRADTLRSICESILKKQKEFFQYGHARLAPLTLSHVAREIDRDESTVSRAIRNKYMDTPRGIFPLKFFFSSAIATENNGFVASRGIMEQIRCMIEEEDKKAPLSDQDIQRRFHEEGIRLARRTVAKYRTLLKIPASSYRRS